MGVFDKLLDSIRLNEEDEDEFYDDDDLDEEDDDEEETRKSFFSKFSKRDKADDDLDDEDEDEITSYKSQPTASRSAAGNIKPVKPVSSKVTPLRRKTGMGATMEVCVIKPKSVEDNREIADTLLDNCTVVLNLEGMDVEVAQRIIDFSSGACYAIKGNLQKISSYIFILTPENVEVTGDIQDILSNAKDMAAIRTSI